MQFSHDACGNHHFEIIYEVGVETKHGCRQDVPCAESRDFLEDDMRAMSDELMREYADSQGMPTGPLCGIDLVAGYTCRQLVAGGECSLVRNRKEIRPLSHAEAAVQDQ